MFLSLTGGFTGSSESIHVKMPHCWKSHVIALLYIYSIATFLYYNYLSFADFTKSLMRIVSNSVFMPQAFAECILLFTVAGSMSFTPKYIEAQFSVPTWKVNMLIGR